MHRRLTIYSTACSVLNLALRSDLLTLLHSLLRSAGTACCILLLSVQITQAATVYVYVDQNGSKVISDHPLADKRLKKLKTYRPRSSVEILEPRHYDYSHRRLDPRSTKFDKAIFALADLYQQDRALIKAIVQIESSFNPNALSPKGAQGLMQLMPATASQYQVVDAFNPRENLRGGIAFFADLMSRYENDIQLALAAYNAGASAVSRYNGIPPYPETQAYVTQVLRLHKTYQHHSGTYS